MRFFIAPIYVVLQSFILTLLPILIISLLALSGYLGTHWIVLVSVLFIGMLIATLKKSRQSIVEVMDDNLVVQCRRLTVAGTLEKSQRTTFSWDEIEHVSIAKALKWEVRFPIWETRTFWSRANLFIVPRNSEDVFYVRDFFSIAHKEVLLNELKAKVELTEVTSISDLRTIRGGGTKAGP